MYIEFDLNDRKSMLKSTSSQCDSSMVTTHQTLHGQLAKFASVPASALAMQQLVVSPARDKTTGHAAPEQYLFPMWDLKWGFRMSTGHCYGRRKLRLLLQQSCQVKLSLNNDPWQAAFKKKGKRNPKWCQNPGANFQSKRK